MWILTLIVAALFALKFSSAGYMSGSFFEVLIDRFEVISEDESIMEWHMKAKKINKTRMLVGYVDFKVPVGDDYKIEAKMLKKQGNEYRYQPYGVPPEEMCKFHGRDTYVYPEIAKYTDFPIDVANNCPFEAKNYTIYGLYFSLEKMPKMILPSGDYAGEWFYRNTQSEVVGNYRIYVTINQV